MTALTPHGHLVDIAARLTALARRDDVPVAQLVAGVADYTIRTIEVVRCRRLLDDVSGTVALGRMVAANLNPSTETAVGVDEAERRVRRALRRVVTGILDLLDGDPGGLAGLTDLLDLIDAELDAAGDVPDDPGPRQVTVTDDQVVIVATTTATTTGVPA